MTRTNITMLLTCTNKRLVNGINKFVNGNRAQIINSKICVCCIA